MEAEAAGNGDRNPANTGHIENSSGQCRLPSAPPPTPSFFLSFLLLPLPLVHFSLSSPIALLLCCLFFSLSHRSLSPSLPWRSPSIFTATLEATCRVLVGGHSELLWVHPLQRHAGSCPWPLPERWDPFGSVSASALPRLRGASTPLGEGAPFVLCVTWFITHSALVFHLQHGAPGVSPQPWTVSSCFCPLWLPSPPPSFRLSSLHIHGECLLHNFF